ncbi:MAG: cysteine--tRNA ligase [Candidatus Omnitrophica bacterium]|nr:cysteine--tRNA ligase [Candidatus Omnitrophota bacterium]MBU4303207.1 cysteine--tRNA ligase [Candidatus Omnitrophota bacterium]MBU4468255.1 cysteine--tRNA ligase [Candidatus Omnitrophota bacterium]MCG2708691.1 cysteine--tRNA ligase [Candidatus Omnitrophota bacterium]
MPIFIYNSLSRKKEQFIPLNHPKVNIYTCGVTVYDDSHIGHARSLYIFDVIRRYLKYRGFDVTFVRNITDVDDKIINRANELKVGWQELVEKYIGRYYEDLDVLGIEKGDFEPRATENIADMVRYIQTLVDKGYAYAAGGDVYFNVRKFPSYGKLSGQSIDQMETGVRIGPSELKHDPLDFALWKKSKENEPSWPSPFGPGRPGWHIECSVMSQKFLKTETLDIHAGGRDLIFPHHENEIAQAEASTGKQFAKYWIHHGLLTINGQKMSKSLGNFITIKDFIEKYKDTDILKLFFLSAHYAHPIDYNDRKIEETRQALDRISNLIRKARDVAYSKASISNGIEEINGIKNEFVKAMDDDFNTPQALSCIFNLVNLTYKNMNNAVFVKTAEYAVAELSTILGLSLTKLQLPNADYEIESKILERNEARKEGNFALADKMRKELEVKGVILEDTKDGNTFWRKKL